MKKILAMLALMIITITLASCNGSKEGSKYEEKGENAQTEAAEKTTPVVETPKVGNNSNKTSSKTEDQVVKDFENELDGLFKLLESDPNAKK